MTMTTVGYGDMTPLTPGGQIFTMLFIVVALTVVASSVGHIIGSLEKIAARPWQLTLSCDWWFLCAKLRQ